MATQANIEIVLASGAKAGNTLKELQQTANRLQKEIKDLKPGSEAFIKKSKDFQKVTGRLKNVRNEVKGVTKAQGGLLSSFAQMLPFGGQLQQLSGKFNMLSGAVGGTTKGLRVLKMAIAATGIGLLLIAIGSLSAMFKSSEEGQDKWNKIMKVAGVIIGNLSDILAGFGEIIFDAIVNPVAAAKKAWEGLKNFFSDPIGSIKSGYEAAKKAASEFITETEKEVKQAQKVAELEAETNRLERKLLVERKQIEAEIAELRLKSKQEDQFSSKQRLEFLNEANELQERLLDKDLQVAKNRFEIIKQTNQFSKSTKENLDAEAQAEANLSQVEVTRFNQARQIERERQRIKKEIARDEKAIAAELAKFESQLQKELDAVEKADFEETKKRIEEIAKLRQQNHENQLTNLEMNTEAETLVIEEAFADRLITEQDQQNSLFQLEVDRLESQLEITKSFYGDESNEARKASLKIRKIKLDETIYLNSLEDDKKAKRMAQAAGVLSFLTTISEGVASLHDKESEKGRKAALLAARMQVFQAALSAYASMVQIPVVGPALGYAAAAAALIFGMAKVEQMRKVKKAERGMILRGRSHAQGGIPIEAEGDEIILTKAVSRDPIGRAMASDLNAMYGGIRFMQSGGPVNPLGSSPSSTTRAGSSIDNDTNITDLLTSINENLVNQAERINTWQRELQVNNNVQDTKKGIEVINKLERDAGF